jgi:hypothetical protein
MRKLITAIIALLLILFYCTGCGPTWYLRQAEKRGAAIKTDTLWNTVEIPVPEVSTDTVFKSITGDTIRIEKERLKIKYVKLPGDSVFIEGKCESDTIEKKVYYQVTKNISVPDKRKIKWWHLLLAGLAGAGLFAILRK